MASFFDVLFDLLSDLTLSGIAYFALAAALNQAVRLVAELLWSSWIIHQPAAYDIWDDMYSFAIAFQFIVFSIAFIHWSTRFLFRCRRHFVCAGKSLAYILRWLSPLHPKPLKTCPCCWLRTREEPATELETQLQRQWKIRRPYPVERMSCPSSHATTLHGEERCLTFDFVSPQNQVPAVSPVSADEIKNEWRDVGNFSDKKGTEGRRSPAFSPVDADESTSGWRDMA